MAMFSGSNSTTPQIAFHHDHFAGLSYFPLPFLVLPFLRVILSPRTTGPVTSIALQAVHRLIIYGIVKLPAQDAVTDEIHASRQDHRDSPTYVHRSSAHLAIAEIAHAVSHCRFEASEAVADELVLLRILAVMRELICGDGTVAPVSGNAMGLSDPVGTAAAPTLADCLGDESICEMMETGLSMCCQMRLSDLLRRTSEQSMTTMVRALFSRLDYIPLAADEAYSTDPNIPDAEPEHATLAAEPVGNDALDAEKEKRLRRMTMPDPKSLDFPAAAQGVLHDLKSIGEQEDGANESNGQEGTPQTDADEGEETQQSLTSSVDADSGKASEKVPRTEQTAPTAQASTKEEELISVEMQPYGLPAVKEVLRVIVSLLDPQNGQHTDSMRLLGLSMLCSVFEVAGQSIGRFPSLRAIVQDSACKHLFELVRSDNPQIQAATLRSVSTVFETMREHLKLQHELFLSYLVDRLSPTFPISTEPWRDEASNLLAVRRAALVDAQGRASSNDLVSPSPPPPPPPPPLPKGSDRSPAHGEGRELIIETLSLLLGTYTPRMDGVDSLVELWVNYDCDVDCENMFEKFVSFLCRTVYASNPLHPHVQESTQIFAIDALLNFVGGMAARQEGAAANTFVEDEWPEGLSSAESLASQKKTKASLLAGAERFNIKPKDGLKYFEQQGFLDPNGSKAVSRDVSIAQFLKECPRLDKKVLGDFLSRPDNADILDAFLKLFDFSNTPIAEAMREMLEAFRLPGESQQISRITETFAKIYFASQPSDIMSEDAVYVLSYSVIMLNTDLHNPQNKRRMSLDDYRRNLRGVNDGKDFDSDFLAAIYDSIRRREIVMPEEHKGQLGFDYTWKELLRRSRKAGGLLCSSTTRFDRAIFEASWRPIVASIAHAFSTYRDEHILERAISGFRQCAILASSFGMDELFDFMIRSLAGATGLLDANGVGQVTNNSVAEVENQQITVSPLSVQFGRNFKGQLAAVVLFTIANGNGNAVRQSWQPIFEIFKNLFINTLLTPSIGLMFEFGSEEDLKPIPLKAKKLPGPPPQDPRSQSSTGLFSTISSYLLSPYSTEREQARPDVAITEEAVESSLCTADCVASCRIDDFYAELMLLNVEARAAAIEALKRLADRYTVEKQSRTPADGGGQSSDPSSGRSTPVQGVAGSNNPHAYRGGHLSLYDPSAAFVLELAVNLACSADAQDAPRNWSTLIDHISQVLAGSDLYHPLQVERAIVAFFRLTSHAAGQDGLRDQIYMTLDRIGALPVETQVSAAPQVTAALYEVIDTSPFFAKSQTEWSIIFSLLTAYGSLRSAPAVHFSMRALQAIVSSRPAAVSQVTPESFSGLVGILREFARGAEAAVRQETDSPRPDAAQARKTLTEMKALEEYKEACLHRGPAAIESLDALKAFAPELAQSAGVDSPRQVWERFWLPLMSSIAAQCINGHRGTRQAALTHLQRILLTPEIVQGSTGGDPLPDEDENRDVIESIFHGVLFPTLHELLRPEVFQLDPSNENGSMQETRMRACNLLCKVFLHYLGRLAQMPNEELGQSNHVDDRFLTLWLTVLDFFDRFMHTGKRDQLTEATPENLKNVLLVMNASGLLLPPSPRPDDPHAPPAQEGEASGENDRGSEATAAAAAAATDVNERDLRTPGQRQLFDHTFERIHRFLPALKDELFP